MSLRSDLTERIRALARPSRQERELDDELRCHLAHDIERRLAAGDTPEAARRAALTAFGSVEACKEDVRDARGVRPLTDLTGDVRYAWRAVTRAPGFALSTILVLGLAIGAAATMFSVTDLVLWSDLPYPESDRLVRIYQAHSPNSYFWLSTVEAQAISEQARGFSAFGVVQRGSAALSGAGAPERIAVARVTAGFFTALGIETHQGRLLTPGDEAAGAAPAMVVSHALAVRIAGRPDQAVGRAVMLDGIGHTIVGVLPAGVPRLAGIRAEAWPALRLAAPGRRGPFSLVGVARLAPGVALDDARRELAAVSDRLFPIWASSFQDREARLVPVPLRDAILGPASRPVWLFAGAVALVLVIAVANVATLMLVRASSRRQELAVRSTLGASRLRLCRLLVTEHLVLAAAAGLVALAAAILGVQLVQTLAPGLPRVDEIGLDARTLAFVLTITLACAIVLTTSSLSVAMPDAAAAVRGDSRRIGTSRETQAWRGLLVGAEFALAVPLLLGAGLLFASFVRLQEVDPGFDPDGLTATAVSLPAARYGRVDDVRRFWRLVLDRAAALPGVTAAGLTTALPPDNGGDVNNFDLLDRPVPAGTAQPVAPWTAVDGAYFQALGIALLDGREFSMLDDGDAAPVLIVSEAWANRYYPRERVVGRQLVSGGCTTCPPSTIVGVVGDVKYLGLRESGEGVYYPAAQDAPRSMTLVVRSASGMGETLRAVRGVIAELDAELPVEGVAMSDRLSRSLADPQRWTAMLGAFAATALGLAAIGIFGLVSYVVRQRRREIGIRMALGADARSVTALVLWKGLRQAAIGTAAGAAIAAVGMRALQPMLFETDLLEATPVLGVAVVLLVSAGAACWLPARRAGRVEPAEILNAE